MTYFFLMLGFLLSFNISASEKELKDFKTDYCTFYKEGPRNNPNLWKHCCVSHDFSYWFGGTRVARKNADIRLKNCVNKVAGAKEAQKMYMGVRLGHASPFKSKMHWGHGWNFKMKFRKLTTEENQIVIRNAYNIDSYSTEQIVLWLKENHLL